ncbi:3-hydroxybutyryl-CoA dehydrogenase [Pseudoflavitalea sp. G-6-1-2]|uniref:3-hydroxyacyl-CoA dehydrogenase NAD-binding domain-containing protein n=1 Tax=Pseudoflavitalea sp. G-6-1-2 TaxID=2728841 RepID=UPI001469D0ED|nr:3-hydroxyacyl-CoA dehydrogenase NAD-binding domain-containing protein [Pseudoflavitalea sp. G-6-1-2]NML19705.1 3-hydroxybutyryl-CoA dehydrogenase [Pseudoflavitalea sp. G-6-1-2]
MIQSVCVCGAGTMGRGIAQVAARYGFHTILFDVNKDTLSQANEALQKDLQMLVDKNKLTAAQQKSILDHIRFTNEINDCIADIVIEAIVEKLPVKVALFNQLAEVNHSETIFATNTSSLSVTEIAAQVIHPERVAGMHFFNPAPLMKLVEVVATPQTNAQTIDAVVQLTKQLEKTPVLCNDAPGFIVNHVARPYYLEALYLAEQQLSSIETIDTLLEATGFKMGPFKLMDLIGNDINYAVSCSVYDQLGQPLRLRPSPLQQEKVNTGALGRKTKKGYYQYS